VKVGAVSGYKEKNMPDSAKLADYQTNIHKINFTVLNTASLSAAIDLRGLLLCGVDFPAALDSASVITLQSGVAGSEADVYDESGSERTITVTLSKRITVDPKDWAALESTKVRMGTAASPTAATADRVIALLVRPI
jgi:hypothetical protein